MSSLSLSLSVCVQWKTGLMSCALGAFPCFLEVEGSVKIYDMADCPSLSSTVADQQKGKERE